MNAGPDGKAGPGSASRVAAARVIDAVLHRGRSLKVELAAVLPKLADVRDRALVEAICFAVLRQRARYDGALSAWMERPMPKRDYELRALLFAGFAQLDALGLPAHAAVASTVEAARGLGRKHQAGLVNALLRRAQREGLPPAEPHAHWPGWLRTRLREDWAAGEAAILDASEAAPPMWLRVNRQKVRRDDYLGRLRASGIEPTTLADELAATLPDAVHLDVPVAVGALPGFAEGEVSVQDMAAQLVTEALSAPAGSRVLDACAAPGGKSAHLLERDPSLRLVALDVEPGRLDAMRTGLARLGLAAPRLLAADATDLPAWWDGEPFDAVLLDAPCSATGIVRRQPDVLLHRRESDLPALIEVQARLLDALWRTVAPGGALVYATCSILKAENETQIRAFLARTPDASAEPLDARFGHDREVGRQRLPGESGGDGFFYARLRRS